MVEEVADIKAFRAKLAGIVNEDVNKSYELTKAARESAATTEQGIRDAVSSAQNLADRLRQRGEDQRRAEEAAKGIREISVGAEYEEEEYEAPSPERPTFDAQSVPSQASFPAGLQPAASQPPPPPQPGPVPTPPAPRGRRRAFDDHDDWDEDDFSGRSWLR